MSYLPPTDVKQGFWIDWSQGRILGSTITTDTTTANLVVAVLAIVVSLGCVHLWHILLFVFYQIRTKGNKSRDGLFHQQQALIRSNLSPEQTLWDFVKLAWTWRNTTQKSIVRSLGPAIAALAFGVGALTTSVTSSFILSTSTITVLVNSNNCGVNLTKPLILDTWLIQAGTYATEYAKTCYLEDSTSASCIKYVTPRIQYRTERAPCPFSPYMCLSPAEIDTAPITLDTGYLDSNDDLGINAHPDDRVKFRKKTTCAPIKVAGYYKTINVAHPPVFTRRKPFPGEQAFALEYSIDWRNDRGSLNYDSYHSNFTTSYEIQSRASGPSFGDISGWRPIEQLRRSDADTILNFIFTNAVYSLTEIKDPVFSARKKGITRLPFPFKGNQTYYSSDHPFGIVACTEQYQYCITTIQGLLNCTQLNGIPSLASTAALGSNENQMATFERLAASMLGNDMSSAGHLENSLLASETVTILGRQQGYLPKDQWKKEVHFWEAIVLSLIQNRLTSFAIGPQVKAQNGSEAHFGPSPTAAERRLCHAQKMRIRGGFANVSVLGLALIIAVTGAIVTINLLLIRVLVFFGKFSKFWGFSIDNWVQDGVLQLQRKAYEGRGYGNWTGHYSEFPMTAPYELLPNLEAKASVEATLSSKMFPTVFTQPPSSLKSQSTSLRPGSSGMDDVHFSAASSAEVTSFTAPALSTPTASPLVQSAPQPASLPTASDSPTWRVSLIASVAPTAPTSSIALPSPTDTCSLELAS